MADGLIQSIGPDYGLLLDGTKPLPDLIVLAKNVTYNLSLDNDLCLWYELCHKGDRYIVTSSLIGWAYSQNDPWMVEGSLPYSCNMIFRCVVESKTWKVLLFGPLWPASDHKYIFYGFPAIINGMRSPESPFCDKLLICKEYYLGTTLLWNEQIANIVRQEDDYQCAWAPFTNMV